MTFVRAAVVLCAIIGWAATAQAQEMISKQHAAALFSMSLDQWNANAMAAVSSGAGKATMMGSGVARMEIVYTSGALLYVLPDYSGARARPDSIEVTLAYPPPMSNMYDQPMIASLERRARTDMAPEFDVALESESVGGGVALFFTISHRE